MTENTTFVGTATADALRESQALYTAATEPRVYKDDAGSDQALVYLIPNGYRAETVDVSKYADTPSRKRGAVVLKDADSFVAYVNQHGEDGRTTIYADVARACAVAVLNGPSGSEAGWSDHTASLALTLTPAWNRWSAASGSWQTQESFAEFVEESLADFHDPDAGHMLELAQTFSATTSVDFESGIRLHSGERQLTYKETTAAKAGQKGSLEIPERFTIGLAPYKGGPSFKVEGWLRYRITNGTLALCVKLHRADEVLDLAFTETVTDLREHLTVEDLLILNGAR